MNCFGVSVMPKEVTNLFSGLCVTTSNNVKYYGVLNYKYVGLCLLVSVLFTKIITNNPHTYMSFFTWFSIPAGCGLRMEWRANVGNMHSQGGVHWSGVSDVQQVLEHAARSQHCLRVFRLLQTTGRILHLIHSSHGPRCPLCPSSLCMLCRCHLISFVLRGYKTPQVPFE